MADKKISALTAASTPLGGTEVVPLVQSSTTKNVTVANLTAGRAVSAASLSTTGNIVSDTLLRVTGAGQIEQNGGAGGLYFLNIATSGGATNQRFLTTNASGVAQLQLQLVGGATQTNNLYGDTRLETGNLIIATAGKGIDFSATTEGSGTMTSELLDDYEEGTWTPTLSAEVPGDLSVTYGVRLGTYTKVGRLVTASCRITTSAFTHTTAADDAQIQGLPFAARTLTNMRTVGSLLLFGANKAGFTQVNSQVETGSSSASFIATGVAGASISSVKITEITSGGTPFVSLTLVYETDS